MFKTILAFMAISSSLVLLLLIYTQLRFSRVDKSLRLMGFIASGFLNFNDNSSFIRVSKASTRRKPLPKTGIVVEERVIETDNNNGLRVLIYRSAKSKPNATGLLWIHGGGYGINTPESEVKRISDFIKTANTVVVSPDYTLSVVKPYPAAFNDCFDTLKYMKDNAKNLGINESQLFVGGGSAGGGLTAALSLYARDSGEVNIAFQMPLYPMINATKIKENDINNSEFVWNGHKNNIAWKMYLGELYESKDIPKYAAPLRETNYNNLPPTFSFVGSEDSFKRDTEEYIGRLKQGHVDVEFYVFKGGFHAFDIFPVPCSICIEANKKLLSAFKYATEQYYAEQKKSS